MSAAPAVEYEETKDVISQDPTVPQDKKVEEEDAVEIVEVDPEMNRRVLRKIDMVIMPLACGVYAMQYLDKRGISFAAIFGMQKELGLVGQEYSWAASVFYFGQLLSNFFAMWALHKFSVRIYVGVTVLIWGGVMMAQGAPKNAAGLIALRFLLGLAEGSASPAFVVMIRCGTSGKREHPTRLAALYFSDILIGCLGGLLLYGLGTVNTLSFSGWRLGMIVIGAMTIVIGTAFTILLPIQASTAWFLTPEERTAAVNRVVRERASSGQNAWRWDQCRETLKDPLFYIAFIWAFLICASTVLSFGTLVINGLGYSPFMTVILNFPSAGMQAVCLGIAVLVCRKFPNRRGVTQMALTIIPMVGSILLQTLPYEKKWPLAGALWLTTCNHGPLVINLSIISSNFKGHTRKTMFSSIYYSGYAVGCIVGPQMFLANEKPLYKTAMRSIACLYAALLISMAVAAWLLARENRRRDKMADEGNLAAIARPGTSESNDSDKVDLGHRYVL